MSPWRVSTGRWFDRGLLTAIILAFIVFGIGGWFEHRRTDRLVEQGKQAHDAICVFRADLQQRVDSTKRFLDTHPGGFAGIPAATLRKSLRDQQRTIRALSLIRCAGVDAKPGIKTSGISLGTQQGEAIAYGDILNCSDYPSSFPTPAGDPNHLDGDRDGVACESNSK